MYIPKRYGQSRIDKCPFCDEDSTQVCTMVNSQGFPVCPKHKNSEVDVDDLKCVCGNDLELLTGKFGPFFKCLECGPINMKKILEFNIIKDITNSGSKTSSNYSNKKQEYTNEYSRDKEKKERKEIFIRSDDPRYFD